MELSQITFLKHCKQPTSQWHKNLFIAAKTAEGYAIQPF